MPSTQCAPDIMIGSHQNSNPRPFDHESGTLTTRPQISLCCVVSIATTYRYNMCHSSTIFQVSWQSPNNSTRFCPFLGRKLAVARVVVMQSPWQRPYNTTRIHPSLHSKFRVNRSRTLGGDSGQTNTQTDRQTNGSQILVWRLIYFRAKDGHCYGGCYVVTMATT